MKICENGIVRDMTPEEIKQHQEEEARIPKPGKSDAERIAELEAQLAALTEGYKEGVEKA